MRAVRFLLGLFAVFLLHLVAERFAPPVAGAIDLFVVLIVFNALDGDLPAGMLGGLVAGLAADTLSGALYGLHGFSGTLTGFLAAMVARQLVVQQPAIIGLLFAVAAVFHEVVLAGLLRLLVPQPPAPDFASVGLRGATSALIGAVALASWSVLRARFVNWRQTRRRRVKMA